MGAPAVTPVPGEGGEMYTCKTCANFNFKASRSDGVAWGNCLSKRVNDSQYISLAHVSEIFGYPEPERLVKAIEEYARIYYREDTFGCRFHSEMPGRLTTTARGEDLWHS